MVSIFPRFASLALTSCLLSGCGMVGSLSTIGKPPALSDVQNPTEQKNYKPVTTPLAQPDPPQQRQANSLWQSGSRAFFKDQRALKTGDILTVLISIQDKGRLNNKTTRTRTSAMNIKTPALLGYTLPNNANMATPLSMTSNPNHVGEGDVDRREEIELKVGALVTQVLPNGNLVIQGKQEIRVNYEIREVLVSGIVRREDILSSNTIRYEKIAEARISYGGRGQLSDVQQPPYGQQVIDAVFPF